MTKRQEERLIGKAYDITDTMYPLMDGIRKDRKVKKYTHTHSRPELIEITKRKGKDINNVQQPKL